MRRNPVPSASQRLRHWAVAAVAGVVALVWVAATLVVPSLAETRDKPAAPARPVTAAMNVHLSGSRILPRGPYNDVNDVRYTWIPKSMLASIDNIYDPNWSTGGVVDYSDGSKGYCIEPTVAGANESQQMGALTFASPEDMPQSLQRAIPFTVDENQQRALNALAHYYRDHGSQYNAVVWQGTVWAVGTHRPVGVVDENYQRVVSQLRDKFLADARDYETNAEMLKSIQVKIVDGDKADQKKVILTGSDQAMEALRNGNDFGRATITISVNGKETTGSVREAVSGGIPVTVPCTDAGSAKISARWSGHLALAGTYTMQAFQNLRYGQYVLPRDQVKFIPSERQVTVSGSAETTVPCTPSTPDTPTPSTTTPTPSTPTPSTPTPTPTPKKIEIATSATDQADHDKMIVAGKDAVVVDHVAMTNLVPGATYTVEGTLMNKATGQPVAGATAQPVEFTAKSASESHEVAFTIPADATKDLSAAVVFESLTQKDAGPKGDAKANGQVVAEHKNLEDAAQTVTVTKPAPQFGAFEVAKTVVADKGIAAPTSFHFEYACDNPSDPASWKPLEVKAGGEAQKVSQIPAGATCQIREKNADVPGAHHTLSWQINGAAPSAAETTKDGVTFTVAKDATVAVAATNTYRVPLGTVTVAKSLVDQTVDKLAAKKTFTFPYVCATGEGADKKVGEGSLTITGQGTASIEKVPAGATCIIGESDAAIADTTHAVTWTVDGKPTQAGEVTWGGVTMKSAVITAPVAEGAEAKVAATNTYTDAGRAGFTVTKKLTGATSAGLADQAFQFAYSCTGPDGLTATGDFALKAGQTYSSIEKNVALAKGATCTVTEKKPAPAEGLTYEGVTFNRDSGDGDFTSDSAKSQVTFTLGSLKTPVAFTAINTYKPTPHPVAPEAQTILATANGGKTITADDVTDGSTVELVDTIRYENLVAGKQYVAAGRLVGHDTAQRTVNGVATFTPEGEAGKLVSGVATVTFRVPADFIVANTKITAFEQIWEADKVTVTEDSATVTPKTPTDTPVAKHEELDDECQTVTITPRTPQPKDVAISLIKQVEGADSAGKTYDFTLDCGEGAQQVALTTAKPVTVQAKVGATCTLTEADAAVKGATHMVSFAGEGLTVTAKDQTATFTVPATAGKDGAVSVIAKNVYTPLPKIEIGTVASNAAGAGDAKTVEVGSPATIKDVTSWKNLPAGSYTVVPALMVKGEGDQVTPVTGVLAAPVPFTVAEKQTSGTVTSELSVPAEAIVPGATFVVYEKIYQASDVTAEGVAKGATPVATHEDANAASQTITVTTPPIKPATVAIAKVARYADGKPITDRTFTFDLSCTQPTGKAFERKGIEVKAGQTSGEFEVVPGATCTVTEAAAKAALEGADPQLTLSTNDEQVKVARGEGLSGSFTVPENGGAKLVITATNTYPTPSTPETPTPSTPTPTPSTPTPSTPTPSTPTPATPVTTPDTPKPPCETPGTPGTPGTHGIPATPNLPDWCTPKIGTSLVDQADGDRTLAAAGAKTVVDTVSWRDLAPGDYVILGSLVDKATAQAVAGVTQTSFPTIRVTDYKQNGQVTVTFTVADKALKPGASYVAFEDAYRAADVTADHVLNTGATPVAQHHDINDAAQTVTVAKPGTPSTPGTTQATPASPIQPQATHHALAKTGAAAGIVGAIAVGMVAAGYALVAVRRRRD